MLEKENNNVRQEIRTGNIVFIISKKLIVIDSVHGIQTLYKIAHLKRITGKSYSLVGFLHNKSEYESMSVNADATLEYLTDEVKKRHLDYIHLYCEYRRINMCVTIISKEFPTRVRFVCHKWEQPLLYSFARYIEENI